MLGEALLPEVLDSIVVGISHKVLETHGLSMGFQTVHQSRTITFYLFWSRDSQENNFRKTLRVEGAEDATAKNRRFAGCGQHLFERLTGDVLSTNDHCFVLSIHGKTNYVVPWHSWELLRYDIFQIYQISHWCELLVIFNHNKLNFSLVLFSLNLRVSLEISLVGL